MDRYTSVPQFHPCGDDTILSRTVVEWKIPGDGISKELLVLSWAALLRSFTGVECPVFNVDGRPVRADLSARTIHETVTDLAPQPESTYSAIITEGVQDISLPAYEQETTSLAGALLIAVDLETGAGYLSADGVSITPSFLDQIGRQLKQVIQKQARASGLQVVVPAAEDPELSIANPQPQMLPGPQLLHQLALTGKCGSNGAIDYLHSDGTVQSLSYDLLDQLSTRLAARLADALGPVKQGGAHDVVIPVLLPQSVDLYISVIAILKAGAAFCPLSLEYPPERIDFIINDVAAEVVVTQRRFATKLSSTDSARVVFTDDLQSTEAPSSSPARNVGPENLAYVMYTSGSTGRPKGVGISHRATTQSLLAHDELIPTFKRFLQFASPTFDVSVFEMFFPLYRGAILAAADRETMLRDISSAMRKLDVDAAELTPTVAGELLQRRDNAPSLNILLTIGEMLTRHVVDEFGGSERRKGILHGMYGPTEAAIHCTVASNFQSNARVNLIGKPFKTVSAYIVSTEQTGDIQDGEPQILPVGHIGELVVGGPQLAEGYINRPDENSKAFLVSKSHGRLYRTGDKARFLPNGDIECFGRISTGQVKLRGQRIELGEIEQVASKTDGVRSAVAVIVDGTLVIFALVNDDRVTASVIRETCKRWLPRFMVPGEYIIMSSFPQLPSGKVDRKALEKEFVQRREAILTSEEQKYRDSLEENIAKRVSETLGTVHYDRDDLTASGLDSLTAIRLASRLRTEGVNLDVGKLLEANSITGIWRLANDTHSSVLEEDKQVQIQSVKDNVAKAATERLGSIEVLSKIENVELCSHIQVAMLAETERNYQAYCNWIELEFSEGIEIPSIKRAIHNVAQENDILRSGFVQTGLGGSSYGMFTWKELENEVFEEVQSFEYNVRLSDENGILNPLRVQLRKEGQHARALIHLHHALYDGWSWELILEELRAALRGTAPKRRPPYSRVTDFYLEFNSLPSASDSTVYWQENLHEMTPTTWPNLNDKNDVPKGTGVVQRKLTVPGPEIEEASRKFGVSRQAIFQAAYGYLLSSYMETPDIVFGTVFSGRTLPIEEIESIIGPCIRVLPTRININSARNIADLLAAVNSSNRKALRYGHLSLQDIKRASGVDPGVSLFDSLIIWQETLSKEYHSTDILREVAATDYLEFAMTLELQPRGDEIHARANYQTSLLPAAQIEVFLEQLEAVVSLFIQSTDLPVDKIRDSLPPSVLSIENENFEPQLDLPRLAYSVEKLASEDPDRIAIEFLQSLDLESNAVTTEKVTYYQLNARANRIAHHLIALGATDTDLVGIVLEKSADLYISILAVAKIGAGYIPITPNTPSDRATFILAESKARFCITDSFIAQNLHLADSLQLINLDRESFDRYPSTDTPSPNRGDNLAYVVFTSGSTGKPKGVLITHRNLQSNMAVLTELYPVERGSKLLQACSQAFDVSVFEIFFSWHRGMTLCSATNDIMFRDIEHVIRTMDVTHLSLTPTVAALIHPSNVPKVKFLVTAGEGYGPSETTNICTVRPNVGPSDQIRNIGRPFKNTSTFVVSDDKTFSLVPRGAVGEFVFGGDQVGKGYLNMPELTNEKFIQHPRYGKLYRSGDFGRLLANGALLFTGRRDDQVKLRGLRIELGEINNVLLRNGSVKDCATMIVGNKDKTQQQLISFWTPATPMIETGNDEYKPIVNRLFEDLRSALPGYMVPSALIPIDRIPMTSQRKIDHRRLQGTFWAMDTEQLASFSAEVEPAGADDDFSDLEQRVAAVLAEVTLVPLPNIHRNTSFYSVGLDSVSAISLSRRLRDAGIGQVDVSVILRQNSVARLAKTILERASQRNGASEDVALDKVFKQDFITRTTSEFEGAGKEITEIIPCTPLQEAMLSQSASKASNAYFNHLLFKVHGDPDKVREAWWKMVLRHDILRTCFVSTDDARFTYAQVILKNADLPWSSLVTTANQLASAIEERKTKSTDACQSPFELPYYLTLLNVQDTCEKVLLLSLHHALHDGEAMAILLQEVEKTYRGESLPDAVPFRKFIEYSANRHIDASNAFWSRYLSDLSPKLLCPVPNNMTQSDSSGYTQTKLSLDIPLDSFEKQCKHILATPLNAFHTAWARLLSFYSGAADVCFGNVFSCRTIPLEGVERIVGPCFNTLPFRVKVPSTATNTDILKSTQQSNVEILEHQLSSLRDIQKNIQHKGTRFFDTLLILQNNAQELSRDLWQLIEEQGEMDFPIICEVTPHLDENKVHICLHSEKSRLTQSDAEIILQNFVGLVQHTVRYPSARAADQSILDTRANIPLSTNGQNDHVITGNSLSELSRSKSESEAWSVEEIEIRDLLANLSGVQSQLIKPETTIFQLGLDSINAVQISGALKKRGYEVAVTDILETPSVSEISSLLIQKQENEPPVRDFDFVSFETKYRSRVCEQLNIENAFVHSGGELYFNRVVLRSYAPLDKKLLNEAWGRTVARHEMLRTGFVQLQDQQYPFAMITYHKEALPILWYEGGIESSTGKEALERRKNILANIHRPPWYLSIETTESSTLIEFAALHAIYDAQSLELVFRDVAAAYNRQSLPDVVPNGPILSNILTSSVLESDTTEGFWKDVLKESQVVRFPDLNPLHPEKGRLSVVSKKSSRPSTLLEAGCRDLGITLQAAGQAAWARLLSAYTGEANVVFGLVLSGRDLSEAANEAVMPCLMTVPCPCRVQDTVRDLTGRIMKLNAGLIKNGRTPLSKIQRWLKSEQGLFDTLFVYQKLSSGTEDSRPWEVVEDDAKIDVGTPLLNTSAETYYLQYPVSIEMVPRSGELELRLTCKSDVVPKEQATLILEQFEKFLMESIFSPDLNSGNYSSVGHDLLSITPAKEQRIPSPVQLLHEFVEESARKTPQKVAFEFATSIGKNGVEKKAWTYDGFNSDGNKFAHLLQRFGAQPGQLIGVCFDKCPEASLGILAVLKAGCAYVALDPNAPIARKQFIMGDAGAKLLLCTLDKKEELETIPDIKVLALDEPGILDGVLSGTVILDRPVTPEDVCYCLYTSGTTGTPKGCELTHDNAVQAMLAFRRLFDGHWDEESRWLQFASFHFDVSVLEQYWSWSVGICVTSCPRDLLFEDLAGTIQALQITHIDLTPSLARLLSPDEVPSLCRGVFITGGEQLKQEILDAWGEKGVIYNGYGPTEVTIGCTMFPRVPANGKPSNIGPQFDNVGSYVFQPGTTTPVLRGSVGELCVSGPLVGRGYLNRPDLTAEKFQFLEEFNERAYRTGDLVRILWDGTFQFLGRIDDQVKLRGQRLEIGEINEVIKSATSAVGEVATLVAKHPKQSKEQLISFITKGSQKQKRNAVEIRINEDDSNLLSAVKNACRSHLPGYMVPTHIIPITSFPLSANNKADAKVLKAMYQAMSIEELQSLNSLSKDVADVDHETLKKVISVLSGFLGVTPEEISSDSSIYELGLDSISVISFGRALREAGFSQAHPSVIMKNPTISGITKELQSSGTAAAPMENIYREARQNIMAFSHKYLHLAAGYLQIAPSGIDAVAPCTPLQEGMIYHFLESDKPLYCSSFAFELVLPINPAQLKESWERSQKTEQLLRTRFAPTPDGYAQVVLKECGLPWFEMTTATGEELDNMRRNNFREWCKRMDDLSTSPWQVGLIRSPTKSLMCLDIFHALYDGNSLPLLLEKVAQTYVGNDTSSNGLSFLDVLPLGPLCKMPDAERFWTNHLKDAPVETMLSSAQQDDDQGTTVSSKLDIHDVDGLEVLRRSLGVTEQSVLHACWLLVLYRRFGRVPTIGMVVSGRALDVAGIEELIGPLFNTLPSNVRFSHLNTWSELVRRCHDYYTSTIPFQHTPLRDIMKWTRRSPDQPLFESLFVFQKNSSSHSKQKLWSPLESEAELGYPLAFEVQHNDDQSLTATVVANAQFRSSEGAQELLSLFQDTLLQLIQNPFRELSYTNGIVIATNGDATIAEQGATEMREQGKDSPFEWNVESLKIRDVIAELSGVDPNDIKETTSIFELGLDSIDAIKVSSRLKILDISLPVSTIMRQRTIEKMAAQLARPVNGNATISRTSLSQYEKVITECLTRDGEISKDTIRVLPATPIQEAMVAEMVASNYARYYNHDILEIEPHVDLEKLKSAWDTVFRANPILRTTFAEISDPEIPFSYAQLVHDVALDIPVVEWKDQPVNKVLEGQIPLRDKDANKTEPLMALRIILTDGNKRYLIFSIAHALYDGWSLGLLHADVAKCYSGGSCERPPYDSVLEHLIESSGGQAAEYWKTTLANCTPTKFPTGANAGGQLQMVHRQEKVLSTSVEKVNSFCKQVGITLQSLASTCWALVLAEYVKRLDVVFGVVLSGRDIANAEQVMFPTMNTVAMRSIIHGTRSEMLRYTQGLLADMASYQQSPLRKAKPDMSSRALFDSLFIYQKRPEEAVDPQKTLYTSIDASSNLEYPVCVELENTTGALIWRVACHDTALGASETTTLLERVCQMFNRVLEEPNRPVLDFVDSGISICEGPAFQEQAATGQATSSADNITPPSHEEWSTHEIDIRQVLASVSGIPEEEISKDATLFHLGLDSISAIKVSSLLKKRSITLPVSDMLKAGTIREMARALKTEDVDFKSEDVTLVLDALLAKIDVPKLLQSYDVSQQQVDRVFPTTSGQTYVLAMNELNPSLFYPAFRYKIRGVTDHSRLNHAWDLLIQQEAMLRTAFIPTPERHMPYISVVLREVQNPVIWHSSNVTLGSEKRSIHSVPVTLHAYTGNDAIYIALEIHHALYDAVSLPKLIDALANLCDGEVPRSESHLDLATAVAFQSIRSPSERRRQFWEGYLGQRTYNKPEASSSSYTEIKSFYQPGLVTGVSRIEMAARKHAISIQALFLAAYARMQSQLMKTNGASEPDLVIVGVYLANRGHDLEGLEELTGPTVNIVPLKIENAAASGEPLFSVAQRIQKDMQDIGRIENSGVSLVEIADWTGVRVDTCVNFLRLPESRPAQDHSDEQHVVVEPVNPQEIEALPTGNESTDEHKDHRLGVDGQDNKRSVDPGRTEFLADIFKPTIDIEAAVRGDALDVGVFGPESLVNEATAETILADLRREMLSVSDTNGH
ncbi:nonribosomal siderophore peptide synthase, putative [Paecilomyces variotii No. 5]|uniref:Nonribosomal peptide synthetase sidC n=1 Tax=Byssochlamys spectabilis (strain No. 5 / NBRC 109023) TaxID=1356009 RepID=V5G1N0_BYSSN|nr:nonribosomal siderophore peptide synthase, putative [Paecilomyces variotii No. 5]